MDTNFSNFQMIDNIDDLNKIDDNQYIKYKDLMGHKIDQIKTANPKLAQAMKNFMDAHDELRRLLGKRTGSSVADFRSDISNVFKNAEAKALAIEEAETKSSTALNSLNEAVKFQRALEALEEGESPTNANVGNINLDLTPEEVFEMQIKAKLEEIKDSLGNYNKLENDFLNAGSQLEKGKLAKTIALNMQNIILHFKDLDEILKETASAIKNSSNIKAGDINAHNLMIDMRRVVVKYWRFYNHVRELAFNAYKPADGTDRSENLRNFQQFIHDNRNVIYTAPYLLGSIKEFDKVTDAAEWALICLGENSQGYANLSGNLKMLMENFAALALDNLSDKVIENYTNALETLKENIVELKPIIEDESVFSDVDFGDIENPMLIQGIAEQNELIKTCNTLIAAFEASPAPNQTTIKAVEIAKNVKQQHAEVCQALIDVDQAINDLPEFSKIRKNLLEVARIPLLETQKGLTKVLKDVLQNQQISNVALNTVYSGLGTNLKISGDILKSHNVVCNFLEQYAGQSLDELFNMPSQLQSFDFHKALDDFENAYIQYAPGLGKSMNMFKGQEYTILHNIVEKFKRLGEEVGKAQSKEKALEDLARNTLESNNSSLGPKSNPFLIESLAKLRNVHNLANQEQNRPNIHSLALADEAALDLIAHANDINVVEEIRSDVPANFSLYQYSEIAAQNFIVSQNNLIALVNGVSDFYPKMGQYALQNIRSALLAYKSAKTQLSNIVKSYKLLTEDENYLQDLKQIDNYLQNAQRPYTESTQRIAKARDNFLQAHNALTQRFISTGSSAYNQQTRTLLENFYKAAKQMSDLFSDNDVGPLLLLSQFD